MGLRGQCSALSSWARASRFSPALPPVLYGGQLACIRRAEDHMDSGVCCVLRPPPTRRKLRRGWGISRQRTQGRISCPVPLGTERDPSPDNELKNYCPVPLRNETFSRQRTKEEFVPFRFGTTRPFRGQVGRREQGGKRQERHEHINALSINLAILELQRRSGSG